MTTEWQGQPPKPPNLRRSRSICVTKYVKPSPIRRTSLTIDSHNKQNYGCDETPISQVRFLRQTKTNKKISGHINMTLINSIQTIS